MSQPKSFPNVSRQRVAALSVAIAVVTVVLLLATEPQIGLTWDEPDYADAVA